MALITPVELEPADRLGPVHFVAIGGAGMSGVAAAYAALGVEVSGSDREDSAVLRDLAARGVRTHVGHDAAHLGRAGTVVVSSAIGEDNPEVREARRRGLRVWHRSAALGALMVGRTGVAVSGTHGKTTTSGMVATMLAGVGADPGYVIGSPLATTGQSSALGEGPFVVEADESDGSFLQYPADVVAITNVEADHLDNWGSVAAYERGFLRLVTGRDVASVVLSADDPHTPALAEAAHGRGAQVWTVGESSEADVRLSRWELTPEVTRALLTAPDDEGTLELMVPGRFNLHNAAAAYAVGRALGRAGSELRSALSAFRGTRRRFEYRGSAAGVRVYDDYAHHPTELTALLHAAVDRVPAGGRLVVAFQPHLFSRTRAFVAEFVEALTRADLVVVCGIYPAREHQADFPGVTGHLIVDGLTRRGRTAYDAETLADAVTLLANLVDGTDVVLTVGAGDVTTLGPALLARLGGDR
ncbi:MAG: UDP-N-acetylmuramate--L-alanine ligase [Propioniciclava sp.]